MAVLLSHVVLHLWILTVIDYVLVLKWFPSDVPLARG